MSTFRDTVGYTNESAATGAVSASKSLMAYIKQIVTTIISVTSDTQIRLIAAGTKTIGTGATKYLSFDSGTNSAEIIGITINGVVGYDWTVDMYIPTADAVAAPAAGDKRNSIIYLNTDTEGGQLAGISLPYNGFLDFTNNSGGDQTINDVVILYRSRAAISVAWEA